VNVTVTAPTASLFDGGGGADSTGAGALVFSSTTDATLAIDPRVTLEHLMQMDVSGFATPPLSMDDADGIRLQVQLAYLATNARDARGTRVGTTITRGIDNLFLDSMLVSDVNPSFVTSQDEGLTATRGGQAGWLPMFTWSHSLPGGFWTKTVTVGAGSVSTLTDAHLVNATTQYVLSATDPVLQPSFYINNVGSSDRHVEVGDTLKGLATLTDSVTGIRVVPESVKIWMTHFNATTGRLEYLNDPSDDTSAAWVQWEPAAAVTQFDMTVNALDARIFEYTFSNTGGWGTRDIVVRCSLTYGGVPYHVTLAREITGGLNSHSDQDFDATGLFK